MVLRFYNTSALFYTNLFFMYSAYGVSFKIRTLFCNFFFLGIDHIYLLLFLHYHLLSYFLRALLVMVYTSPHVYTLNICLIYVIIHIFYINAFNVYGAMFILTLSILQTLVTYNLIVMVIINLCLISFKNS